MKSHKVYTECYAVEKAVRIAKTSATWAAYLRTLDLVLREMGL